MLTYSSRYDPWSEYLNYMKDQILGYWINKNLFKIMTLKYKFFF